MTSISLRGISRRFDQHQAVAPLDLDISSGSLFALLGPSGCGKTTLLRMIAGLETQDQGQILFNDTDISTLPAEQRRIGMVFQHYALFPHMNVAKNVAYGLHSQGVSKELIPDKVKRALELVGLGDKAERAAPALSGGEQQRVALARAIVTEPQVLLFDEPLSNLDARLRIETRLAIRRLVSELKMTSIFVTHDQEEALSIADDMAVMRNGHVLQQDTPARCYQHPATAFVGRFLGQANILTIDTELRQRFPHLPPEHHCLLLRPEHLRLCEASEAVFSAALSMVEFQGAQQRLHLDYKGQAVEVVMAAEREAPAMGSDVFIGCNPENIRSFENDQT